MKTQITQIELDRALMLLITSKAKKDDAVCASEMAWCEAITILAKYAQPDFNGDPEYLEILENALETIKSL